MTAWGEIVPPLPQPPQPSLNRLCKWENARAKCCCMCKFILTNTCLLACACVCECLWPYSCACAAFMSAGMALDRVYRIQVKRNTQHIHFTHILYKFSVYYIHLQYILNERTRTLHCLVCVCVVNGGPHVCGCLVCVVSMFRVATEVVCDRRRRRTFERMFLLKANHKDTHNSDQAE